MNSIESSTILTGINIEDLSNMEKRSYKKNRILTAKLTIPKSTVDPILLPFSDENTSSTRIEFLADGDILMNLQ